MIQKRNRYNTIQCFEEGVLRETRGLHILCDIQGSESLHLHNILKANFKNCKCGLELENTTLQCFEEVQKEPRGAPFHVISPEAQRDITLQCFEEVQKEPRGAF